MIDAKQHPDSCCSEHRRSARVLIVDDCALSRRIAADLFRSRGCLAEEVRDGTEALSRLFVWPLQWSLVLMDVRMPTLDGFETVSLIRRKEKEFGYPALSIVAVSASMCESDRRQALRSGYDAYIAKPLDVQTVRSLFTTFIGNVSSVSTGDMREPRPGNNPENGMDLGSDVHEAPDMSVLVGGFLKSARLHIADMRQALNRNDVPSLVGLVHTLKGSSMLFGYADLTGILCRLEGCIETLDEAIFPRAVSMIRKLVHQLERELGEMEKKAARQEMTQGVTGDSLLC